MNRHQSPVTSDEKRSSVTSHQLVMSYKRYVVIWVWLAGLMLLGVLLSYLPLAHRTVALAVLGLSAVKVVLVGAYYMHLKYDSWFLTFLVLFPLPLGVLLAVVTVLDTPWIRLIR